MKKAFLSASVAFLTVSATLHARLGETPLEVRRRYGPALYHHSAYLTPDGRIVPSDATTEDVHLKNGMYVCVQYRNGKCVWVQFQKAPGASPSWFSPEERDELLERNCGRLSWTKRSLERTGSAGAMVESITPQESFVARSFFEAGTGYRALVLWTGEYFRQLATENKAFRERGAARRLSGF